MRDCRKRFPPLTGLVPVYYLGVDGQEVVPPVPLGKGNLDQLDRPLEVGVVNGGTPMAGAIVDLEVFATAGAGKVAAPGGAPADKAAVVTDAFAIARCEWRLDAAPRTPVVEARFRDPLGQSRPRSSASAPSSAPRSGSPTTDAAATRCRRAGRSTRR